MSRNVDYSQGKIYKIVNDVDSKEYIGSTCKPLYYRFGSHLRHCYENIRKCHVHKYMLAYGPEHFKIILIENYPC